MDGAANTRVGCRLAVSPAVTYSYVLFAIYCIAA